MQNEFTDEDHSNITLALAQRVESLERHMGYVLYEPLSATGQELAQCDSVSYWVREWVRTSRTLIRARQVFWS